MSKSARLQARQPQEELDRFDGAPYEERVRIFNSLGRDTFTLMYGKERIPMKATAPDYQPPMPPQLGQGKYPDGNPKTQFGIVKPRDWYTPTIPYLEYSLAHLQGALKYGPFNWRDDPISMSTYLDAAISHINLCKAGQDRASDTDIDHLGHAMTCLSIVLDARAHNTLIDDRFKYRDDHELKANPGDVLERYMDETSPRVKAIREKWTGFAEKMREAKQVEAATRHLDGLMDNALNNGEVLQPVGDDTP